MCADPIDTASELELLNTQIALANRTVPEPRSLICRNGDCGEPSREACNYCSPECRQDHERELWAMKNRRVA